MDEDKRSADDPMGQVEVPFSQLELGQVLHQWFPVTNCPGCSDATGELELRILVGPAPGSSTAAAAAAAAVAAPAEAVSDFTKLTSTLSQVRTSFAGTDGRGALSAANTGAASTASAASAASVAATTSEDHQKSMDKASDGGGGGGRNPHLSSPTGGDASTANSRTAIAAALERGGLPAEVVREKGRAMVRLGRFVAERADFAFCSAAQEAAKVAESESPLSSPPQTPAGDDSGGGFFSEPAAHVMARRRRSSHRLQFAAARLLGAMGGATVDDAGLASAGAEPRGGSAPTGGGSGGGDSSISGSSSEGSDSDAEKARQGARLAALKRHLAAAEADPGALERLSALLEPEVSAWSRPGVCKGKGSESACCKSGLGLEWLGWEWWWWWWWW